MSTPLASKTTISSRNKIALLNNIGNHNYNRNPPSTTVKPIVRSTTATIATRIPPKTTFKQPLNRLESISGNQISATSSRLSVPRSKLPETNVIRKGFAKFTNPRECQRQFEALDSKIKELNEINENEKKKVYRLQDQLKQAIKSGIGYAITVQYFAKKLKLDSEIDLETQCEQLKTRIERLLINEREYENKLESIIDDYKSHLQIEQEMRTDLEKELEETKKSYELKLDCLKEKNIQEIDDLIEKHSNLIGEIKKQNQTLEAELKTKCRELSDLRVQHETLNNNFNKLEESLTKDKNARVKYAQEKIHQLQKDVESLNSVLEMKTERIHALEKDSLLLGEAQHEAMLVKDRNKALMQQLESMNAALDKRREQYENLLAEHEKVVQELKRERKDQRSP